MRSLLAVAVLLSAVPAVHAQKEKEEELLRSSSQLKDRFKGVGRGAVRAAEGGPAQEAPGGGEVSIADLEALLLKDPNCRKSADAVKDLDPALKGKFSLVACENDIEGQRQIVLVPKAISPSQQLAYGSIFTGSQTYKLKSGRFFKHYFVIEFDKQVQYLDLNALDNGGFALAGYVSVTDRLAAKFTDDEAFADALRRYMGIAPSSPDAKAADEVPANVAKAIGSKKHLLTGAIAGGELVVTAVHSGGETVKIWSRPR